MNWGKETNKGSKYSENNNNEKPLWVLDLKEKWGWNIVARVQRQFGTMGQGCLTKDVRRMQSLIKSRQGKREKSSILSFSPPISSQSNLSQGYRAWIMQSIVLWLSIEEKAENGSWMDKWHMADQINNSYGKYYILSCYKLVNLCRKTPTPFQCNWLNIQYLFRYVLVITAWDKLTSGHVAVFIKSWCSILFRYSVLCGTPVNTLSPFLSDYFHSSSLSSDLWPNYSPSLQQMTLLPCL